MHSFKIVITSPFLNSGGIWIESCVALKDDNLAASTLNLLFCLDLYFTDIVLDLKRGRS